MVVGDAHLAVKDRRLRSVSLGGLAALVTDPTRVRNIRLWLARAVPHSRQFHPSESQQRAIYAIGPVAISLVDYEAGYRKIISVELGQESLPRRC